MTEWTPVLHVEPLAQADTVEEMIAFRHFRCFHFLVANGADVGELTQLLLVGLRQGIDLVDGVLSLHEYTPAGLGLAPQIEVGVDAHHEGAYGAARLEHQNPKAVAE